MPEFLSVYKEITRSLFENVSLLFAQRFHSKLKVTKKNPKLNQRLRNWSSMINIQSEINQILRDFWVKDLLNSLRFLLLLVVQCFVLKALAFSKYYSLIGGSIFWYKVNSLHVLPIFSICSILILNFTLNNKYYNINDTKNTFIQLKIVFNYDYT